jgi:RNA polymerase sigma-70 factor (ECF subfamily)
VNTTNAASPAACFDDTVLPHLDAAYRLARWLLRNDQDAEDAVQEAALRAFKYFRTFSGGNGRAWFIRFFRNTCSSWRGRQSPLPVDSFDEDRHIVAAGSVDPETTLVHAADASMVEQVLTGLPEPFRELLVLRELEGLSYLELADVLQIPIGTVMSRLSRARQAFRAEFTAESRMLTYARCGT